MTQRIHFWSLPIWENSFWFEMSIRIPILICLTSESEYFNLSSQRFEVGTMCWVCASGSLCWMVTLKLDTILIWVSSKIGVTRSESLRLIKQLLIPSLQVIPAYLESWSEPSLLLVGHSEWHRISEEALSEKKFSDLVKDLNVCLVFRSIATG